MKGDPEILNWWIRFVMVWLVYLYGFTYMRREKLK
jgi:hypothetical protein